MPAQMFVFYARLDSRSRHLPDHPHRHVIWGQKRLFQKVGHPGSAPLSKEGPPERPPVAIRRLNTLEVTLLLLPFAIKKIMLVIFQV